MKLYRFRYAEPNDKERLIQIADALDAAKRIHPNIIQMSDELARQIASELRRISEALSGGKHALDKR